jgi:hypothetical protein
MLMMYTVQYCWVMSGVFDSMCDISEVTSKLGVVLQIHACIAITNGSVCVSAKES